MKPTAPRQQSFSPPQVKQVVGEFGDQELFSFLISSSTIMNDTESYDFWLFLLKQKFLTRRDFASQGYVATFGHIFAGPTWGWGAAGISWSAAGMLLNVLQNTGQSPSPNKSMTGLQISIVSKTRTCSAAP